MRRILASRAADTYAVASIEKIGTVGRYSVIGLAEIAGLVTDAPPSDPTIEEFARQGVNIISA